MRWYLAFRYPVQAWDTYQFEKRYAREKLYQSRVQEYDRYLRDPTPTLSAHFPGADVDGLIHEVQGKRALYDRIAQLSAKPQDFLYKSVFGIGTARGELLYAMTRLLKPEIILETGVANGYSSAFFLQALADNGRGHLHSVEYPPMGHWKDPRIGILVPPELRNRWTIHLGNSKRILPKLVRQLGKVDLFLHDSDHCFDSLLFELRTTWPAIPPSGVLLSDDITMNNAFVTFCDGVGRQPINLREPGETHPLGFVPKTLRPGEEGAGHAPATP